MNTKQMKTYHAQQFAELAGVTVRALHYYDRLTLLKPRHRALNGYRVYSDADLGRLEQIVVLKFLGLPLKQIRSVLDDQSTLCETLRRQSRVLLEKRRQLDGAIRAIESAEKSLRSRRAPDWEFFKQILKEIEMQNDTDWMMKYYSEEARAKIEKRKPLWNPEMQAQVTRDWNQLFADIEAALACDADPASAKAQALAARWRKLVQGFTGGDPEIQKGLNAMSADSANWPKAARKYRIRPAIQAFIVKAMKAGGTR